jgi:TetR/AcrR family transcriptional repressor of mexJK operon
MTDTAAPQATLPGSRAAKPQQILEAARELFIRDGFSGTSMDAVAKSANVSKATIYAHFASKEELFGAMMSAECRRYWPELTDLEVPAGAPVEVLHALARRFMRFITGSYAISLLRIVASEATRIPELGRIFYEAGPARGRARFADFVRYLDRIGVLNAADPVRTTDHFFSLMRGDLHIRCLIGIEVPSEEQLDAHAKEAVELFLKLYGR